MDPAVAEEFKRQRSDLQAEYDAVKTMAAKLKAERERIRAEYPAPRDPLVGNSKEDQSVDIRARPLLRRVSRAPLLTPCVRSLQPHGLPGRDAAQRRP